MPVTIYKLIEAVEQRIGGDAVIQTDKEALLVSEVVKATLAALDYTIHARTGEVTSARPAPSIVPMEQGPMYSKYSSKVRRKR